MAQYQLNDWRRIMLQAFLCLGLMVGHTGYAATETAIDATTSEVKPTFPSFDAALKGLSAESLSDKQAAVESMVTFNQPAAESILSALADGKLYADNNQYLIADGEGNKLNYVLATDAKQKIDAPASPKKITINNKIRVWIKDYVAEHALSSSDPAKRLAAMQQVVDKIDDKTLAQVRQVLPNETDKSVKTLMQIYLAKADLNAADLNAHAAAIDTLAHSPDTSSRAELLAYIDRAPNATLKAQATAALKTVDNQLLLLKGVETLSYGLSLGSILVLAAIGLAITFGVMGVINMAHGELIMIGAYCAYVVQQLLPNMLEYSILIALPVAFIVSALVGILIERFVVRYLYGRPLETLLATFGVSLILQQAVRSLFSPLNRMVESPKWMSGAWDISSGLSITWNRVYIIGFCLLCFFALLLIMKKTRLGLEVRAVSQNRAMARSMGISDRKVDMLTFGLGSGMAGLAGVALSQLTNVGPNLGQAYIVDSFMVVVVGGVGNLWGTLVSGLTLGVLNKFFEPWLGAVLAKAIVLVLIIVFMQKYPRGLFPQKGRSADE